MEVLANGAHDSLLVVQGLLSELSLYFLLYSEAANLRHMPEALWFVFYTMSHAPEMGKMWEASLVVPLTDAREARIEIRNSLQVSCKSHPGCTWPRGVCRCLWSNVMMSWKLPRDD
jgi:hypothetical protein